MCTVCGCGDPGYPGHPHSPSHHHGQEPTHAPFRPHHGQGPAGVTLPGQGRLVRIERDLLAENDAHARRNRAFLERHRILALNLVSSPGSGKTSLLERTLRDLRDGMPLAVIEGDQQTSRDAERIRATGVAALQINTGKGCHLDAHQIGHALEALQPHDQSVLFIENVGNLVCPALFDLGEAAKVALLSVTEGEDKPLKYPELFHRAAVVLLNKIDLLPHLDFDLEQSLKYLRQVNGEAPVLQISAVTGAGLDAWYAWLKERRQALLETHPPRDRAPLSGAG
ncbi:hydrogenase nickel incorporation protein HypB [Candidatus Methylocalor cossyra]|uniref:Hydrogenase maturation factor HypB n=1 Tax=Candidatus Methylocalor cossyra TaxID=3108543 RepID=A0ABM9NI58_9GAMM